jgi:hypothetical protein
MKVLNFFIASGIVTSLLSSISSTAIYADDTVSDDYSKYAYIDRNFEKNSRKKAKRCVLQRNSCTNAE